MRKLILKLTATLAALLAGGCNMPSVTPQPVTPVVPAKATLDINVNVGGGAAVTVAGGADVNVKNAASDQSRSSACDCGCGHASPADCEPTCPRRAMNRPSSPSNSAAVKAAPQLFSKPVVELLTDFDDGLCGACDLAWNDWLANGKAWPFVLAKRRGTGGRTSPTFVLPGGKAWSPSTYSVGGLLKRWSAQ